MNNKFDTLLAQVHQLEKELVRETRTKESEFCDKMHTKTARFTQAAKVRHQELRTSLHSYVQNSRFFVLLTSPVIWLCAVPILLADLVGSFYQAICFPIYGIPKVNRHDYLAFDRRHLTYLNFVEKVNCEYCAYANGILAYFTEIAARTEQHWCPVKHAGCVKCSHSRYKHFVEYGDAEQYRLRIEEIRRSLKDLVPNQPEAEKSIPAGL